MGNCGDCGGYVLECLGQVVCQGGQTNGYEHDHIDDDDQDNLDVEGGRSRPSGPTIDRKSLSDTVFLSVKECLLAGPQPSISQV